MCSAATESFSQVQVCGRGGDKEEAQVLGSRLSCSWAVAKSGKKCKEEISMALPHTRVFPLCWEEALLGVPVWGSGNAG